MSGTTIEPYCYRLTREAMAERQRIEREAMFKLKRGESVQLTKYAADVLALPYERPDAPDSDTPASGMYEPIR